MSDLPESLVPRSYDAAGRLQMAESRLEHHTAEGTAVERLFLVRHYAQPDTAGLRALTVVAEDGQESVVHHNELRGLPARTVMAVLECAGNGRGMLANRAPGNQFGLGLFGQNEWTGASLRDVLGSMATDRSWETLVVSGLDEGHTMPEDSIDRFAKGLPREKALDPDTILAWEVDGKPVPDEHGGPVRLVVPGWYGIWWVKWPQRIELTTAPFDGFWQNQRYTYQAPDGTVLAPVADQLPRAVLHSPSAGEYVNGQPPLDILAWAGGNDVALVEFTVDDGQTWLPADRTGDSGRWGWSRWTASLPAGLPRGLRRVAVRATDEGGRTQDWQPEPNRLGYGNNGIHAIEINLVAPRPSS